MEMHVACADTEERLPLIPWTDLCDEYVDKCMQLCSCEKGRVILQQTLCGCWDTLSRLLSAPSEDYSAGPKC